MNRPKTKNREYMRNYYEDPIRRAKKRKKNRDYMRVYRATLKEVNKLKGINKK